MAAQDHNVMFLESSVMTGDNVETLFMTVSKAILAKRRESPEGGASGSAVPFRQDDSKSPAVGGKSCRC